MEPAISFYHAALKVKWASIQLQHLHEAIGCWLETKPYTISVEPKAGGSGYTLRVGVLATPFGLPCMAGDVCHNLRSALDFAWMGLVRAASPHTSEKKTLPIASNRQGLKSTIGKATIHSSIEDAERLLINKIGAHFDFDDGGNRVLAALNAASNWEKHNMLPITPSITTFNNLMIKTTTGTFNPKVFAVQGNVIDVASLGGDLIDFRYDGEPTVEVFLETKHLVGKQALIPTLSNFRQTVIECLEAFVEVFPSGENPNIDVLLGDD